MASLAGLRTVNNHLVDCRHTKEFPSRALVARLTATLFAAALLLGLPVGIRRRRCVRVLGIPPNVLLQFGDTRFEL